MLAGGRSTTFQATRATDRDDGHDRPGADRARRARHAPPQRRRRRCPSERRRPSDPRRRGSGRSGRPGTTEARLGEANGQATRGPGEPEARASDRAPALSRRRADTARQTTIGDDDRDRDERAATSPSVMQARSAATTRPGAPMTRSAHERAERRRVAAAAQVVERGVDLREVVVSSWTTSGDEARATMIASAAERDAPDPRRSHPAGRDARIRDEQRPDDRQQRRRPGRGTASSPPSRRRPAATSAARPVVQARQAPARAIALESAMRFGFQMNVDSSMADAETAIASPATSPRPARRSTGPATRSRRRPRSPPARSATTTASGESPPVSAAAGASR